MRRSLFASSSFGRLIDHLLTRMATTLRGRNALFNVFEMWVALAGIVSGLVFFYSPAAIDRNALAQTVGHNASACWSVGYFVSGLLIWHGLLRPSPRTETMGLYLLGSATAINGIAIMGVFGLRGAATSITLFTLTAAAWVRATLVVRASLHLAEDAEVAAHAAR